MEDKVAQYILEGCLRVRKPSLIQRYVFRHYGYYPSLDLIRRVIFDRSGLKPNKPCSVKSLPNAVNVVELTLEDMELFDQEETGSATIRCGGASVELPAGISVQEAIVLLQNAGVLA